MQHIPGLPLGVGTWGLGLGTPAQAASERAALTYALDHGVTTIDTAEMYGDGAAETLVGETIANRSRSELFLISKFYPWHATPALMRKALVASLRRLRTDYLDLYLLHWPGNTPLADTMAGLAALQQAGLIRAYGVSNFNVEDLKAARAVPGGDQLVANEVLYNVQSRGIEYDLQPYQDRAGIDLIGYSPFGSGDGRAITIPNAVQALAATKGVSAHQLLLAWTMRSGRVLSIPKAASLPHMRANLAAARLKLTPADLAVIDAAWPAPTHPVPLESI